MKFLTIGLPQTNQNKTDNYNTYILNEDAYNFAATKITILVNKYERSIVL